MEKGVYVCAVGNRNGEEIAKIESPFHNDITHVMPMPPERLIFRATGQKSGESYLITGLRDFNNFWNTISNYVNPRTIDGILEWGCGSGRITGFFSRYSGIEKLHACDIDLEAVKWGKANFDNVVFDAIGAWPPTRYEENSFSVIISYSILTHLSEKAQHLWLEEIARMLVPNGLFLTTVHGESLLEVMFSKRKIKRAIKKGIFDKIIDNSLKGIAPSDYYRSVFHTKNYIFRTWKKYFDILEYRERGGGNWQDLIVMRKRS
jgi:SAM-dependent methyltransferase